MCRNLTNIDTEVKDAVAATLVELVADEAMFTSYDVTRLVREDTDANVRHNDVRAIVNEEMDEGDKLSGYLREMRQVEGRRARVFVPHTTDPTKYDPAALVPVKKVYDPVLGFDV
jgi:hypothetical protein